MLMVPGIYTGYVVALGWISSTMPRPPAKRAAALAFINAVSNTSSIFASYMFDKHLGPRYILAMTLCCVMAFIAICAGTVLRFMLVRLNKKLERGEYVEGAINGDTRVDGGAGGLGDGEAAKKGFRFLV